MSRSRVLPTWQSEIGSPPPWIGTFDRLGKGHCVEQHRYTIDKGQHGRAIDRGPAPQVLAAASVSVHLDRLWLQLEQCYDR